MFTNDASELFFGEHAPLETFRFKLRVWYRYVIDTFIIWPHDKDELNKFLEHLNNLHSNIMFTVERGLKSSRLYHADLD